MLTKSSLGRDQINSLEMEDKVYIVQTAQVLTLSTEMNNTEKWQFAFWRIFFHQK